ncbi:MAG: single-stranded-DNA-specific exonuclease RecJ [Cytophagaceae bacterium]
MEKRWDFKAVPEEEQVVALSKAINVNEIVASVLIQRGVHDFDSAKAFFRPALESLHDPFLMKDMDKAVSRLEEAIAKNQRILIYGDYDVDGTTSVSLMYGFLQNRYDNLEFYIPDRYSEGYGVSTKGIEWARENNVSLIISLDCGIKSLDKVDLATQYGIDFIICDHHRPGEELPQAVAVLDPKREDCAYPYKELSGCGVGFKLLQAYCQKNSIPQEELFNYLDLVAISIASDIVPITGENRTLTYYGLKLINKNPRPGVKALIEVAGFKKALDVTNVVFGLGPRINAAGRIAHAKSAVNLLISETLPEAQEHAKGINDKNSTRKDFDSAITQEALQMIEENQLSKNLKSTVLFKNDWHKGVIGIVASRCIEKYYRPTIILTESNNYATGSARSVYGFDVYEAISQCSDLLEHFGGHMYAAGLTMKLENVQAFRERFEDAVASAIKEEHLLPRIEVDLKIRLNQINEKLLNLIDQMGPFGPQNMQPVFVSEFVCDDGRSRVLKEQHLKLSIRQDASPSIEAIGFGMGHYYAKISEGKPFHLCYSIGENEFNGNKSLQLSIRDIKFPE